MCGIVARFGPPDEPSRSAADRLRPALQVLSARGPDAQGAWRSGDGRATLGHTRLALVGGDAGAQPCVTHGGQRAALLNGDLYGWRAVAETLTAAGHPHGGGDVGVLSALWQQTGDDFVDALRGEFALVVVDVQNRRLLAARDRFGVRPLLYAVVEGALWLGSTLAALFSVGVPRAFDEEVLGHALRHQYLPPGRTLAHGVFAVPPGGVLIATLDDDDRLRVDVRTKLRVGFPRRGDGSSGDIGGSAERDLGDLVTCWQKALDAAVVDRLDSDQPVGALLSGGVDGAAVLASAVVAGARPPAFCARFDVAAWDESGDARAIARALDVPFVPVDAGVDALLDALPAAVRDAGWLCINGQLPARRLLARALRDAGIAVVLSGEGSDELGLGYPHLFPHAGLAVDATQHALARQRGVMLAATARAHAAVDRRLGFTPAFLAPKLAFGERLLSLCTPERAGALAARDPTGALLASLEDELADEVVDRHPAHVAAWLWTRLVLGGYILGAIADAQDGAHGLQGRPPFLDDRVLAAARATPVTAQVTTTTRGPQGKSILRAAVRGRLPDNVVDRPKHPFLAPPLLTSLTPGSARRTRVRDQLYDGLGRVPGLSRDRALAWFDGVDVAGDNVMGDDAVLWTLLSAVALGAFFAESR
jgi:asparagine synthase (glutamine-hydrolysing)